jgi:hypothetical protein
VDAPGVDSREAATGAASSALVPLPKSSFQLLLERAHAGDAVAQRKVAERQADCFQFLVRGPDIAIGNLYAIARELDIPRERVVPVEARARRFCEGVYAESRRVSEDIEDWWAKAAEQGDLVAELQLAARAYDAPMSVADGLMADVVASGSPEAVQHFANLVHRSTGEGVDPRFLEFIGSEGQSWLWEAAACRLGAPCGPGSRRLETWCMSMLRCDARSWEEELVLGGALGPGDSARVDELVRLLSESKR